MFIRLFYKILRVHDQKTSISHRNRSIDLIALGQKACLVAILPIKLTYGHKATT